MIVLAIENRIANLEKLEACIRYNLPNAEIHGFVNGLSALDWAEKHTVDIVFAQYAPEDEEVYGAEGAVAAHHLYISGECKNIVLCADKVHFSIDAWNSYASFFYLKPVSNKKIHMALDKLRYPLNPVHMMSGRPGVTENHLTKISDCASQKHKENKADDLLNPTS